MDEQSCEIGMVGLGVMGRNFVLNMAEHGAAVAGYDTDSKKVNALRSEAKQGAVRGADTLEEFIGLLRKPRAVMMLVPAGQAVDSVIQSLSSRLEPGDLIIDGGNSHFKDTERREKSLAATGILYLGVGISGGEHGARFGPSLMPGGPKQGYERVRAIFEASAAQVNREPCVTYVGGGSAGHYVKMVHNGIEYGLMQLIAETYDLMKRGLGLSNDDLQAIYDEWNREELSAYLMEITAHIFRRQDEKSGASLIDVILDKAEQKGTGAWTSQDAMALEVPVPTIDAAVALRSLSVYKREREAAGRLLGAPKSTFQDESKPFVQRLRNALYAGMVITYAQGMALLRIASQVHGYGLNLKEVARIWRGGCIIRAAMLEDIHSAYAAAPDLANLLVDSRISQKVMTGQADLRAVVGDAVKMGIPVPGLMASLAYYDGYRSSRLPANLIQAQRDYFGAHTYERVDSEGAFHTQWNPA